MLGSTWLRTDAYRALLTSLEAACDDWYEPVQGNQGFITVNKLNSDQLAWTNFMIRAKRAAQSAGFSGDHSAKLAAAIGELYSNVIEHSQNIKSGYVVFCGAKNSFEFVVADSGIGVLSSLRSNPSYASLVDSGTALELALSQGISRHIETGHGNGFRPLIVGLANISRFIRFRSDDHSRELIRGKDQQIYSATRQDSRLRGFFCSVECEV